MTVVCNDPRGPHEGGHRWQYVESSSMGLHVVCCQCETRYRVGDKRLYAVLRELYPEHARTIGFLELVGTADIG
jgi:hypothetical protein